MRKSKYSEEFKKASVQRVLDGESQKIVAADLGINPKTLSLWVVLHKAQMSPSDLNQLNETEVLRRQVRQLKAELEFKKSSGVLCEAVSVKYAFIEKSLTDRVIGRYSPLSLKRASHLLKVSHSGFARWKSVKDQSHAHGVVHSDVMIVTQTKALINENHGYVPGVVNLYHQLQNKGYRVDVKRLRCPPRNNGIVHRWHRKYVTTTDSNHNMPISPNLLMRQFDKFGINEAWCGDITYIDTEDGWPVSLI